MSTVFKLFLVNLMLCVSLFFSNTVFSDEKLFHLNYKEVEKISRVYLSENHPEINVNDIQLNSISIYYGMGRKFSNLATVSFKHKLKKTMSSNKFEHETITLNVKADGKIVKEMSGTSKTYNWKRKSQ